MYQLLMALLLVSCSPKVIERTQWQPKPVMADGKPAEWEVPLRFFDKNTQLNYTVTNDAQNLYLAIRVTDENTMRQISMSGLKVAIDTIAKSKNGPFVITYPSHGLPGGNPQGQNTSGQPPVNQAQPEGTPMPVNNASMSPSGQAPPPMRNGKPGQMPEMILFSGFKGAKGEQVVLASESPKFKVGNAIDASGTFFMEMVIPFETFLKPQLVKADSNLVLSVKLSIDGGMQGPPSGGPKGGPGGNPGGGGMDVSMGGGMGGMQVGGGGGMPGGGGGPGGGKPGDMGPGEQRQKKQEVSFSIALSTRVLVK